jgi:hypothetical protein
VRPRPLVDGGPPPVASTDKGDLATIWYAGKNYFWIASALTLGSAALFYKQRSLLAFYYGPSVVSSARLSASPFSCLLAEERASLCALSLLVFLSKKGTLAF